MHKLANFQHLTKWLSPPYREPRPCRCALAHASCPVRRGQARKRRSAIRLAQQHRAPRRRRRARGQGSVRERLIEHLLSLPGEAELNVTAIAAELDRSPRMIRYLVSALVRAGGVERRDSRGGRGRGLRLAINHPALTREKLGNVPPLPFLRKILRSASACGAGPDGRGGGAPRRRGESNWPVTWAQLQEELARNRRCRDPVRRMSGWQRLIRRSCGKRGLQIRDSKQIAKAWAIMTATIGKASKREASCLAVIERIVHDKQLPPMGWRELRAWLNGCEQWVSDERVPGRVERVAKRSEQKAWEATQAWIASANQPRAAATRPLPKSKQQPLTRAELNAWVERMQAKRMGSVRITAKPRDRGP
jgi:hypothetical protein